MFRWTSSSTTSSVPSITLPFGTSTSRFSETCLLLCAAGCKKPAIPSINSYHRSQSRTARTTSSKGTPRNLEATPMQPEAAIITVLWVHGKMLLPAWAMAK